MKEYEKKDFVPLKNVISYFFNEIVSTGRYAIDFNNDDILIIPRINNIKKYDQKIVIDDLDKLEVSLNNYINTIYCFYNNMGNNINNILFHYLSSLIISINYTEDFNIYDYIDKKAQEFGKDNLDFYSKEREILTTKSKKVYAYKYIDNKYVKSPFVFSIYEKSNNKKEDSFIINYLVEGNTCHIYSVRKEDAHLFDIIDGNKIYNNLGIFIKILYENGISNFLISQSIFLKNNKDVINRKEKDFFELLNNMGAEVEIDEEFINLNSETYLYLKFKTLNRDEEVKISKAL